jgi:hypothetical protein
MGMLRLNNMRGDQTIRPRLNWDSANSRLKLQTMIDSASSYSNEKLNVEAITADSAASSKSLAVSSATTLSGIPSAASAAASGGGVYKNSSNQLFVRS